MMTRGQSMPLIIVAGIFDIMRAFFTLFVFFGPALAGLYCTIKGTDWIGSLGGATATVCVAGATAGGILVAEITTPLGIIMADAVGFAGFLLIGLLVVFSNMRLLKAVGTAPMQFAGAFLVAEIPFLGAFPVFAVVLWRLYGAQIRSEQQALEEWKKKNAATQHLEARDQQAAVQTQIMQIQEARQIQFEQEQAANDVLYEQKQAANDDTYDQMKSPDEMREAA